MYGHIGFKNFSWCVFFCVRVNVISTRNSARFIVGRFWTGNGVGTLGEYFFEIPDSFQCIWENRRKIAKKNASRIRFPRDRHRLVESCTYTIPFYTLFVSAVRYRLKKKRRAGRDHQLYQVHDMTWRRVLCYLYLYIIVN